MIFIYYISKIYIVYIYLLKKKKKTNKKKNMLLKRKNIPHRIKKTKNKVTLGIHALTKTDETKSNQTEPYPSTLSSLTKKKRSAHSLCIFLCKGKGGGESISTQFFLLLSHPSKICVHTYTLHTYIHTENFISIHNKIPFSLHFYTVYSPLPYNKTIYHLP
jgi:hypothetical protein